MRFPDHTVVTIRPRPPTMCVVQEYELQSDVGNFLMRNYCEWQVILPEHAEGEMSARLVADAYWMPPSDDNASTARSSSGSPVSARG